MARYGDTLRHYSTENTARDMDMIRAALGDQQISYLGISYGTYLGAIYATLFPERVQGDGARLGGRADRRDRIRGPTSRNEPGSRAAFDELGGVVRGGRPSARSPMSTSPPAGTDSTPASTPYPTKADRGQPVNQVVLMTATIATMYSELQWPVLGTALADAERGDGTDLLEIADSYNGRHDDGTYDTIFQSFPIISCASGLRQPDPRDPAVLLAELQAAAPRFSRGIAVGDLRDECLDFLATNPPPSVAVVQRDGTDPGRRWSERSGDSVRLGGAADRGDGSVGDTAHVHRRGSRPGPHLVVRHRDSRAR